MLNAIFAFLLTCFSPPHSDMMMRVRSVMTTSSAPGNVQNPSTHLNTYYRYGTMRRKDSAVGGATPSFAEIADCKKRTGFFIDLKAHEYRTYKLVRFWPEAQLQEYVQKNSVKEVRVESRTVDTGERKEFFGHSAKHLITTIKRAADGSASGGEEIIDGWYIDHELPDNNCTPEFARREPMYVIGTGLVQYPELPQFQHSGPLPTGLAVVLIRTVKDSRMGQAITMEETIEDLSDSPISPSLFEVPSGFHENPQLLRSHVSSQ
jgi:hypothetical protein